MFYSHQLLARKAPLGQIWMAATMHAKINRKKLDKLNIIKICEEILNPSVPMALRLSSILMGGVVIVYERKVKLLYDDITRLLVEINEAWKVKAAPDPTILPKGKFQAKYEKVTMPEIREFEIDEIELSRQNSSPPTLIGLEQTTYIAMRLDNVEEPYMNNHQGEGQFEHYHQADAANITLFEHFDSYEKDRNHFERFDIEGDDETQLNFTPQEHIKIPDSLIPSPPQNGFQKPDNIQEKNPEVQIHQQFEESKEVGRPELEQRRQGSKRGRARGPAVFAMDNEHTIIPGHIYQTWIQNASDIVSRKRRKRKYLGTMSTMKMAKLMELPPVVLACHLAEHGEIHYPAPLLEQWMRSTRPPHDLHSGRVFPRRPPEPSSSSPQEGTHHQDQLGFPHEDLHSGVSSRSCGISIEKQMTNLNCTDIPFEIFMEGLRANTSGSSVKAACEIRVTELNLMVTPGNSGDEVRFIPSSGSTQGFQSYNSNVNPGRSNKKRPCSSSRHSGNSLEPVAEEPSWQQLEPNFKLARLSENALAPENDLLVETGPTQTQKDPIVHQPSDHITDSIRKQLKTYFDMPGCPAKESLNELASGMNKKRAAVLFYQTCVLATHNAIKVEQMEPYGDILISKGANM